MEGVQSIQNDSWSRCVQQWQLFQAAVSQRPRDSSALEAAAHHLGQHRHVDGCSSMQKLSLKPPDSALMPPNQHMTGGSYCIAQMSCLLLLLLLLLLLNRLDTRLRRSTTRRRTRCVCLNHAWHTAGMDDLAWFQPLFAHTVPQCQTSPAAHHQHPNTHEQQLTDVNASLCIAVLQA